MSREEKVKFIVAAIYEVEGVKVLPTYFTAMSDEQLDEEVEWYEYLLTK